MWWPTSGTHSLLITYEKGNTMFTIDSALSAEIDYRSNRIRETWSPRRRGIRSLPRPRRPLPVAPAGRAAAAR
jgi:hypothetical protein